MKDKPTDTTLLHWLPPMPTKSLKLVRNVLGGVTINDILSTACGRAVWRYMTEPCLFGNGSEPEESSCVSIDQYPSSLAKRFTLSEVVAITFWPETPKVPGNNVGGCRITVQAPSHWQKRAAAECDASIIKDLSAKRNEIKVRAKGFSVGLSAYLGFHLIPNILPMFLLKIVTSPRRLVTYMTSNVRALPVTIEFFGLPLDRMFIVPPFAPDVIGKFQKSIDLG
jgi:hypothetical protein